MKHLITINELSEAIQMSVSHIKRLRHAGMPYLKISHRCVRFQLADVLAWLEQRYKVNTLRNSAEEGLVDE